MYFTDCPNEEAIFTQAIQIADRQARSEFLDQACCGDAALRESLEQLLACHDTAGDYLETSPLRGLDTHGDEISGDRIQRYELLECIGEGGFGVVYRALQLVPLRRTVALKIIRLGMDSKEVVRRFEAERQVMSMMSHPHIAAVLDAGTTESGRPYFGMEFVDGEPIDEFCEHQQLSVSDILQLFLDVCRAIQHAHQKSVVHRDLKPSNVIVVAGENRPIPKVIDFGIAKALAAMSDEPLYRTAEHRILGTPGYMSPEQVSHDADVDTRADVYALGGILYRLLVGVEPIDTVQGLGIADTYQRICDSPIKRPSLRLRSLDSETRNQVAAGRHSNPTQLARTLSGDLDWIVMRSLEKDPDRRYGTVQELAADVARFLRHEPVSAGPPTLRYRCVKFVRRNWIATGASLLIAMSLLIGGTVATIGMVRANQENRRATKQWQRAERQRLLAAAEAEKATGMLQLLERMVGASHPDQGHPPDYTMRQLLRDFSDSFEADLSGQPEIAARLHRTIGRAYWSLGEMPRAGEHLARSRDLYSEELGDGHLTTAQTGVDYALYLIRMSRVDEARDTVLSALRVLQQHAAEEQTVWAHYVLARVNNEHAKYEDALEHITLASDIAQRAMGPEHPLAISMRIKASTQLTDLGKADEESRKALSDLLAVRPEHHMDVAEAKRHRAIILVRLGQYSEAEQLVREAMEVHENLLGSETSHLAHDMLTLTRILRRSGRRQEAIKQAREALDLAVRVTMERDLLRQSAYQKLAALLERNSPRESLDVWERAIDAKRHIVSPHIDIAKFQHRRAGLFVRLENLEEATDCYRNCLQTIEELAAVDIARGLGRNASRENRETVYYVTAVDLLWALNRLNRLTEAQALADEIRIRANDVQFDRAAAMVDIAEARMRLAQGDPASAKQRIDAALAKISDSQSMNVRIRAVLLESEILTELKRFKEAQRKLVRAYRIVQRRGSLPDHFAYLVARQLAILFQRCDDPEKAAAWTQRANSFGEAVIE